jgi:hypothetical protein
MPKSCPAASQLSKTTKGAPTAAACFFIATCADSAPHEEFRAVAKMSATQIAPVGALDTNFTDDNGIAGRGSETWTVLMDGVEQPVKKTTPHRAVKINFMAEVS